MQPFVLRGFLKENHWPIMELWTEKYLRDNFAKNKGPVTVRFGNREHVDGEILHDHKSIKHQFESFSEMLDWMLGQNEKEGHSIKGGNLNGGGHSNRGFTLY
uniref:Uncharacterized protein n=2 Tax=Meloidogyne incognita group TaxID=654580 RepID=A0A914MHK2_MELIC